MTTQNSTIDRRSFLKISTLAGGSLLIGVNWLTACRPEAAGVATLPEGAQFIDMNAHIKISPSGWITLISPNPELGQGVKNAMPMIVAEELDADWARVIVEQAPLAPDKYERQVAGGSYSIRSTWDVLRKAGATVREMMKSAAAQQWQVDAAGCTTAKSAVIHPDGKQQLGYHELIEAVAEMEIPEDVPYKDPGAYQLLGTRVANVDNDAIVTGKPIFGQDTRREGMLYAMVVRPPAFGQQLKSVEDTAAKAMPGIRHVVTFDNKVAIAGDTFWQVKKGRDALRINWSNPDKPDNSTEHTERFKALIAQRSKSSRRRDGNAEQTLRKAATVVEGVYEAPFLPHNPMEPMNFFAHVREDGVELIGPSQAPLGARDQVARKLEMPAEKISLMLTRQGGGFGRRLNPDFVEDAAMVSKLVNAPVQLMWTREDDMTAGIYRPAAMYHYRAGLDEKGELIAWHLRSAGANAGDATLPDNFPAGAVPNFQVDYQDLSSHVSTGAWRAPNHNFVAYAEESFLDEIAHAAGKDPVAFRLELLEKARAHPVGKVDYDLDRYRAVIEKVVDMAGWGKKAQGTDGRYQGIAAHFGYGTYIAQIAEVSVDNGAIKVHKVYCAVDCGTVINLSGAENQVEGGIIDGIGHGLFGEQPIVNGLPAHKNFDTYRLIKMREAPDIEVAFIPSKGRPEGLGEPPLPPAAGAVANAVFAATGKRLRKQPLVANELLG